MREILEEIKCFKVKRRGCVPNLRGASPVGRGEGGYLYTARTVGRSRPSQRHRDHGGVLGADR